MKKIKTDLYESLTPRQRVIATIEAEARGDSEEVQKLVKTCPKKTYRENDAEYSDKMQALYSMALAVECERRGAALLFMLAAKYENFDTAMIFLQNMSDTQEAWHKTLEEQGIDSTIMRKGMPESFTLLEWLDELLPDPDQEKIVRLQSDMLAFMGR